MDPILKIDQLSKTFGGFAALNGVNLTVKRGERLGLIGPNGSGKTTLINCISGSLEPSAGHIHFDGRDISAERAHVRTKLGIARSFQIPKPFSSMTVMENLLVAQHRLLNRNLLAGLFQTRGYRQAQQNAIARALDWLEVVGLRDCANRLAGTLPYGYQRRIEIARAMCTQPQLICLDEPAAGLNPRETEELAALIQTLRAKHKVTVFLIEHDMGLVMGISDHIVVLDYGRVIAAGTPAHIAESPAVIQAYLGVAEEETAQEARA